MVRFICWALAIGLSVGFGLPIGRLTLEMAKAAVRAHQQDQMSYSKFTKALLDAKPRASPER